jgi:hypothetical protein
LLGRSPECLTRRERRVWVIEELGGISWPIARTASFEDVRRYQLHLTVSGVGVPTVNQTVSTLRFFFKVTLGRSDIVNHTQFVREPRKLPVVLSPEGGPPIERATALSAMLMTA